MVLGMLAQVGSKHLHLPGIVLLLLSGILFGPDGLNWIDPKSIGPGLHILVGFAVAIILFEGGMNLRISRILRERRAIRGLIIKGAIVTLIGGTPKMIVDAGGKIPFRRSANMNFWCSLVKQNFTRHESFIYRRAEKFDISNESIKGFLLPIVLKKKKTLEPIDSSMNIKSGNQITFLINKKMRKKRNATVVKK